MVKLRAAQSCKHTCLAHHGRAKTNGRDAMVKLHVAVSEGMCRDLQAAYHGPNKGR